MTLPSPTDARPDMFIGVDGGGSTCRARMRDRNGRLLGQAEPRVAKVSLAFGSALATVAETVREVIAASGIDGPAFRLRALIPAGCSAVEPLR